MMGKFFKRRQSEGDAVRGHNYRQRVRFQGFLSHLLNSILCSLDSSCTRLNPCLWQHLKNVFFICLIVRNAMFGEEVCWITTAVFGVGLVLVIREVLGEQVPCNVLLQTLT